MTNIYIKIKFTVLIALSLFYVGLNAQTFVPISVTGFNHDLVANGVGGVNRAEATTTITFDDANLAGSDNVMYSTDFRGNNNPNSAPPFGLPMSRLINSVNLTGANYELAPYDQNNALVLKDNGSSGTLTLGTPGVFSRIAFLGASAQGASSFNVMLNFSDGTNTISSFTVPDWFFGPNFAVKGIGRVTRTTVGNQVADFFTGDSENPRLYDNQVTLNPPFNTKILTSITFQKTSSGGSTAILAINGITAINAPAAPVALLATQVNTNSFSANWQAVSSATAYFLDVSDSPNFSTLLPGFNNRNIGNVLTFNVTGIGSAPVYYYRVRASNAAGISASSNSIEVCLLPNPTVVCNDITVSLSSTGDYTLTQDDINTIGNGSKDNCGDPEDISFSLDRTNFSCSDLILGQPNNYAIELDGINDFIQSNATNVLKILPLTIEAWVKPALRDEVTDFYPNNILSNDSPGLFGHGFGANVNSTVNQITIEYQNGFRRIENAGLSSDTWQHIAVVYTSGNVKTYVNGILIDDFNYAQAALLGTGSFWIGKHNDDTSYGTRRFYKGQLDEVRVWHRALSGAEIMSNMNTTSVGDESDLQLYYTFEDGPGKSTVSDILGNSNADFQADMNSNTSWVSPGAPVNPAVLGQSVTLTMTNGAGLSATCNAKVTIEDHIIPLALCPTTPPTVVIDEAGTGILDANSLAGGNSIDNCPLGLVETSPITYFTCGDAPSAIVVLTATDGSGNVNTTTCTVLIDDFVKPIVTIESIGSLCGGDSIILSANSAAAIKWEWQGPGNYTGTGMEIFLVGNNILAGSYTVSVTDVNGCIGSDTFVLEGGGSGVQILSNFLVSGVACSGDSIRLIDYSSLAIEEDVTFDWDFGDGTVSSDRDPIKLYNDAGLYTVTLIASHPQCAGVTIEKTIEILACRQSTGPKEGFSKVYPTPSTGDITLDVRLPEEGEIWVKVRNQSGQLMDHYNFGKKQSHKETISINFPGVYLIEVFHPFGVDLLKTIILH